MSTYFDVIPKNIIEYLSQYICPRCDQIIAVKVFMYKYDESLSLYNRIEIFEPQTITDLNITIKLEFMCKTGSIINKYCFEKTIKHIKQDYDDFIEHINGKKLYIIYNDYGSECTYNPSSDTIDIDIYGNSTSAKASFPYSICKDAIEIYMKSLVI